MNDFGIVLAWLAVQVSLFLIPALGLVVRASRRGPATAAWAATLSLGLVAALSVATLIGFTGRGVRPLEASAALDEPTQPVAAPPAPAVGRASAPDPGASTSINGGWSLSKLRSAWLRFGRGAAGSTARIRPWGNLFAVLALAGMTFSLVRLATGVLAVAVCRRRARLIDDPEMAELLDRLRAEMDCRRSVELREEPDLTSPATAGWYRPVVLLPSDWRTWKPEERRAVLAHELAHVTRGDYAAGLVARLAVALHAYHPLVWWTAGRLDVLQEQAADALAARVTGGRSQYLIVLARLALKHDGRSPRGLARAFLPGRGTLIRRIAMLHAQPEARRLDRTNSRTWRLFTSIALIGLAVAVAGLRGPALAVDEGAPVVAATSAGTVHDPIAPVYAPPYAAGLIAVRPASLSRHASFAAMLRIFVLEATGADVQELGKKLNVEQFRLEDVEWATFGFYFGRSRTDQTDLHSIGFSGLTLRTFAPFDWPTYLRRWKLELNEVREGEHSYYRIDDSARLQLGAHACFYMPNDRTIVLDEEEYIRPLATGDRPAPRPYLQGPEWERASRGLLAVAIDNEGPNFKRTYDLGRPDDAIVLSLFQGVSYWVAGIDDSPRLSMHAQARCAASGISETIAGVIESLLSAGRKAVERGDVVDDDSAIIRSTLNRMAKDFLANARTERTDRTVSFHSANFGALKDVDTIQQAELDEAKRRQVASGGGADAARR